MAVGGGVTHLMLDTLATTCGDSHVQDGDLRPPVTYMKLVMAAVCLFSVVVDGGRGGVTHLMFNMLATTCGDSHVQEILGHRLRT